MKGSIDDLIETLAADVAPARPLRPPMWRAAAMLAALAAAGGLAILLLADIGPLLGRYAGREPVLVVEAVAIAATGILAVIGAYFLSIPGRSRRWLLAPLPPFAIWLTLSGAGCLAARPAEQAGEALHRSTDCLVFILAISLAVGLPLLWRLARARPVDPLPVALLGGLGAAALAAFLLLFFHPFSVTWLDLGVHVAAIAMVVGAAALVHRRALAAA